MFQLVYKFTNVKCACLCHKTPQYFVLRFAHTLEFLNYNYSTVILYHNFNKELILIFIFRFKLGTGEEITVGEYFLKEKKVKLKFPFMPDVYKRQGMVKHS